MKRFASIDIGTNTILLLIAEKQGENLKVIYEAHRIPRLGRGVDSDGSLDIHSIFRAVEVLVEYKKITSVHHVETIYASATSAVRDSSNKKSFCNLVKKETGISIEVLNGYQEAMLSFIGAIAVLHEDYGNLLGIIDIGGGSTEIAAGNKTEVLYSKSYDMGSVRYTERYIKHMPVHKAEIQKLRRMINKSFTDEFQYLTLIGVGGTVTTINALINHSISRDEDQKITIHQITELCNMLAGMDYRGIRSLNPEIMSGREDVILAGALILESYMIKKGKQSLVVSRGGIRHGYLLKKTETSGYVLN